MFAPALILIGHMLTLGLLSTQAPVTPAPVVVTQAQPAQTAVRDYASVALPQHYSIAAPSGFQPVSAELSSEEENLVEQTNRDREAQGLNDLMVDPLLCLVARGHSADMSQRKYFDHLAPTPGAVSPMDRYLAALGSRPNYAFLGENIYYRSATDSINQTSIQANTAFMHSEGHRANILQPKFTKIGVGFYRDPTTGAFWVTEMFLREAD